MELNESRGKLAASIQDLETTLFDACREETIRMGGNRFHDWNENVNNIIDVLRALELSKNTTASNSLIALRASELFRELNWIQHAVFSGAYHSAIRDMRFHLESMVQAHWLWKHYPEAGMDQKFELIPLKKRAKELFHESGIERQAELYELFDELSKYVHPSRQELAPVLGKGVVEARIMFCFDEDLFEMSRGFTNRTVDGLLYIILKRFPEAASKLRLDRGFLRSLEELESTLVLELLATR